MEHTAPEPRGGTDYGPGRYSVPQAARYLGISERAVRKRIDAGTLRAERDGQRWIVLLDAVPGGTGSGPEAVPPEPDCGTAAEPIDVDVRPAIAASARSQLEAIRDEWLQPLVEQITDLSRQLGRVEAERDHLHDEVSVAQTEATNEHRRAEELRAERDTLQGRVRALEAEQTEWLVPGGSDAQTQPRRAWWRVWER